MLRAARAVGTNPLSQQALARPWWRGERQLALAIALLLAFYGNAFSILDNVTQLSLGGTIGGALVGLMALGLASRSGRAGLSELGLRRAGLRPSLLSGLLLGLAMGLPCALYLILPDIMPVPVRLEALRDIAPHVFLALVLVKIPLATALAEELAFRGLLQARLRAAFGPWRAILIGAFAFMAWHVVVSASTLMATNLAPDPLLAALAYLGQNVAVFAAGLLFGILRERSSNLAGCVVAHAVADILLIGALYLA